MSRAVNFYRSTVGKKQLMAATGLILVGFVIMHMLGHLIMFAGRDSYNAYAQGMKNLGPLLWLARIILLVAVVVHIVAAFQVIARNRAARPHPYAVKQHIAANYASLTMRWGGPLLLLFVIYHLAHHTLLLTGPGYSSTDIYGNMVAGFKVPWIVAVYLGAMILLGMHLFHGVWSMLQSLGVDYPAIAPLRYLLAPAIAVFVAGGYCTVPLAVIFGIIK